MGIAQSGTDNGLRIVTERTKMAMPEVNIGLFPDVGGGYFLSRCDGDLGTYLGLTGDIITAADALYAKLADVYLPTEQIPSLLHLLETNTAANITDCIRQFAQPFQTHVGPSSLASHRRLIDQHFAHDSVPAICAALNADQSDDAEFARHTLSVMQTRSPLLMCVTLEQLRRSRDMNVADCLRLERTMVRHCFKHGEVLEGIRALLIDKNTQPHWNPATLEEVRIEMIQAFFEPVWPGYAHPLRELN